MAVHFLVIVEKRIWAIKWNLRNVQKQQIFAQYVPFLCATAKTQCVTSHSYRINPASYFFDRCSLHCSDIIGNGYGTGYVPVVTGLTLISITLHRNPFTVNCLHITLTSLLCNFKQRLPLKGNVDKLSAADNFWPNWSLCNMNLHQSKFSIGWLITTTGTFSTGWLFT